jgi:UDP-2,4-diacetamido-2,4,6-trideoxy-beta-L-altropyranose hydrolase
MFYNLVLQEQIGIKLVHGKKTAFFRFDASPIIGAGHAIRCSALGDALTKSGWKSYVVTNQETYDFIPDLNCFERIEVASFESSSDNCDLLILDHYGLDEEYEQQFGPCAKKLLVIDDHPTRPHHNSIDYKDCVPSECTVLAGSQYAMLRENFEKLRSSAQERRDHIDLLKPRILLSLGGGDSTTLIKLLLDGIVKSGLNSQVDVVVGFSGSLLKDDYDISQMNQINFYTNPNMAQLTLQADIGIGAAGSSMWERCCLGLPTIMITTGEDQLLVAKNLNEYGAALYAGDVDGLDSDRVIQFVNLLINDHEKRQLIQKKAFQICDGQGVQRIVEEINASY